MKNISEHYDRLYTRHGKNIPWWSEGMEAEVQAFFSKIEGGKMARLLDSGCWYAKIFPYLDSSTQYVGLDISSQVISECRTMYPSGSFIAGDIRKISIDGTFDSILDIGCLHMIPPSDQRRVLDRYFDLLNDSGYLLLRFFENSQETPLFFVDDIPVWGCAPDIIIGNACKKWNIEHTIVDDTQFDLCKRITYFLRK